MNEKNQYPSTRGEARRSQRGRGGPWAIALVVVVAALAIWQWKVHHAVPGGAAASAAGGFGGGPTARRFGAGNKAQPVSVRQAERRDIRVSVSAIGSVQALNTAVVHVQVSGVLQKLLFTEGQMVRAGQWLAQIDPRSFQAAVDQAAGALARDQAQLAGARVDLERYRGLAAKDAIPHQTLDSQLTLVGQLEGTVALDKAALETARLQLSYTRVTAPIPGRVGLKQADIGNVVNPGDANGLVSITQTQPIALTFAVPSDTIPKILPRLAAKQPMGVVVRDRAGSARLARGTLATTDNSINTSTDTLLLKAFFPNADGALFPNQAVNVSLQLDTLPQALAVPSAAVQRGAQGFYVWVVGADEAVSAKVVKPGPVDGDWQAVDGPVQPGERVVVDGVDRLRDGAKVEIIAADPNQRAGAGASAGGRRHAASGSASGAAR